jgi:GNAT superfamily N-acetyltransferase
MSLDVTNTGTAPTLLEPVTLRPATLADARALALVGAATFLEAFTWMLPGADIVAHCARVHIPEVYAAYLTDPCTRATLATAGEDAPVGYTLLCTPELPSFAVLASDIELKRIYLLSRFRGSPVVGHPGQSPALVLLNTVMADARALGRTRLLLGTHAGNQRAIGFYRRNGFAEAGERSFQVGSQLCKDLIFAKEL